MYGRDSNAYVILERAQAQASYEETYMVAKTHGMP